MSAETKRVKIDNSPVDSKSLAELIQKVAASYGISIAFSEADSVAVVPSEYEGRFITQIQAIFHRKRLRKS